MAKGVIPCIFYDVMKVPLEQFTMSLYGVVDILLLGWHVDDALDASPWMFMRFDALCSCWLMKVWMLVPI